MAEIVPFRGVHFDAWKVGGLDSAVAPPYDVISPRQQQALYATGPHNIVRLILNAPEPGDDVEAPYGRAAEYLRQSLETGVLVEDPSPCLYEYQQEFTNPADGQRYRRTGLFCALKLEPYSAGVVLPHEETRTKAKEDRLRLMRATRCNPEPIFGLYEDPQGLVGRLLAASVGEAAPDLQVTLGDDTHEVRRVTDPEAILAIRRFLAPGKVWIADGHHRYETALAYRDEVRVDAASRREGEGATPGSGVESRESRVESPDSPGADYILIVLTAFTDPGLVVLPTHRLVRNVTPGKLEQLPLQLERYFNVEPVPLDTLSQAMAKPADGDHHFGMVDGTSAYLLTLRDPQVMDAAVTDHSAAWKRLDVSILQTLVLDRSLGIPAASLATTPDIGYTRDVKEAIEAVRGGEYQLAFLLGQPQADEVRQVAAAGDKMPPKSTFFYPKLWSGLLLRLL